MKFAGVPILILAHEIKSLLSKLDEVKNFCFRVDWSCCLPFKVAGHPARSAARLCVENEWEICHVDLSLQSNCMAEIASQI